MSTPEGVVSRGRACRVPPFAAAPSMCLRPIPVASEGIGPGPGTSAAVSHPDLAPPPWQQRRPWLALYLSSAFFAVMAVAVKLLTGGAAAGDGPAWRWFGAHSLSATQVVFWRSLIPFALLLPVAGSEYRRAPEATRTVAPLLVFRGLCGGLAMWLYFVAIEQLGLSTAVVLNYTSPLWATLFSAWFLGEPTTRRVASGFVVAFAGLLLTVRPELQGHAGWGYAAGLGSGVLAGFAYVAVRRLTAQVTPAMVVCAFSGVTLLVVAPLALPGSRLPDGEGCVLLAVAGVTALAAQLLMTAGYRVNSTSRASTLSLSTVAFSTLAAVAVLGERPEPLDWVGLALTMAGVALATSGKAEGSEQAAPQEQAGHGEVHHQA